MRMAVGTEATGRAADGSAPTDRLRLAFVVKSAPIHEPDFTTMRDAASAVMA